MYSILQQKLTDITSVKNRLDSLQENLLDYRNNETYFNNIYDNIFDENYVEVVPKKRKTTFDLRTMYKQIYVENMDTVIQQLKVRFENLHQLVFFHLLAHENFVF